MKRKLLPAGKRIDAMRRAFDESFAASPSARAQAFVSFLAIRLGRRSYAVPLDEIGGMFARKPVTRLPTSQPALLGLAHFRGNIAPVYDLRFLLSQTHAENPGWIVVASAAQVAFAFEHFEGHVRVTSDDILTDDTGGKMDQPQQSIRLNGKLLPVVHLPSIISMIENMTSAA